MKNKLTVGFVTTYSGRWPKELPESRCAEYGNWLENTFPEFRFLRVPAPVNTTTQIQEAVSYFRREQADLVIMLYGAFTGDDFPCALADGVGAPLILWAPYEPPFVRDDRLYANALVAMTMNNAAVLRLGRPCHPIYGSFDDSRAVEKLRNLLLAYAAIQAMRGTLFGLFGYRPTAFYSSAFHEALIRRTFGVRMEETDLKVVFDRMSEIPWEEVQKDMEKLSGGYDTSGLPDGHLENHSRLYLALKQLMAEQGYGIAAIKCWPEMGNLHTTPCAVLGRLADDGLQISCEGDVEAGLAALLMRSLQPKPVFVTDMIHIDERENTFLFWHCGNAAPSLRSPDETFTIHNHPLAGQGTAFWGALQKGPVTAARLCEIGGEFKLFLLRGEAVETQRTTRGIMVNVRLERPVRDVLDTIWNRGVAHHYSLIWEDLAEPMRVAAGLLGIEVIS